MCIGGGVEKKHYHAAPAKFFCASALFSLHSIFHMHCINENKGITVNSKNLCIVFYWRR
jgi:hypothetical protein